MFHLFQVLNLLDLWQEYCTLEDIYDGDYSFLNNLLDVAEVGYCSLLNALGCNLLGSLAFL